MTGFISKKLETIKTLGERLQEHRKEKGVSQEKAAKAMNINVRYIKQLEADRYDELPPDIYTMSILKNYAEYLNLTASTALDIYKKEKDIFEKTKRAKIKKTNVLLDRLSNFFLNPNLLKYLFIFIIIASVLIYIGWSINRIVSPPRLTIDSPTDNFVTSEHKVTISGQTESEVGLYINNRPILADRDGKFSLEIDLQDGENMIKISAQKKHSKENSIYRKVIVNKQTK